MRLMETDFLAAMLVPPFRPAPDWAESLAENLLRPKFPISIWEAFGRRFRRNYIWIYAILWLAWLLSIWLRPTPVTNWAEFANRAAIGSVSAWVVLLIGVVFNGALLVTGFVTKDMKEASGEVFSPVEDLPSEPKNPHKKQSPRQEQASHQPAKKRAWFRPARRREQCLAFVITNLPEEISDGILNQMGRGVTSLSGTGMYSHQERQVLMCALTITELGRLKTLISQTDPQAFVISSPVQEVFGSGFSPLKDEG